LIELQLAHPERNSVRAAYNKAQLIPERRKMMQGWADYLAKLNAMRRNKALLRQQASATLSVGQSSGRHVKSTVCRRAFQIISRISIQTG